MIRKLYIIILITLLNIYAISASSLKDLVSTKGIFYKNSAIEQILNLNKENKSWFSTNLNGKVKVFNCPLYYLKSHNDDSGKLDYLTLIFSNKGDNVSANRKAIFNYMREKTKTKEKIKEDSKNLESALEDEFGKSRTMRFGNGKIREKVDVWENSKALIILSLQNKEFVSLTILSKKIVSVKSNRITIPVDISDRKISSNVTKRSNGDVIIENVPMINQGSKGYCTPAIWTRYLNYLGIYITMHNLAQEGTVAGGGTIPIKMKFTVDSILSPFRKEIRLVSSGTLRMKYIKKYINKGLPLVWHIPMHTRMIIVYNLKTEKIAYTDSWGKGHEEKWMTFDKAKKITTQYPLEVID